MKKVIRYIVLFLFVLGALAFYQNDLGVIGRALTVFVLWPALFLSVPIVFGTLEVLKDIKSEDGSGQKENKDRIRHTRKDYRYIAENIERAA